MDNIIIVEGDTEVAVMSCGCCGSNFRGILSMVTTANKHPICSKCIERFNPIRVKMGMSPMPYLPDGYLE